MTKLREYSTTNLILRPNLTDHNKLEEYSFIKEEKLAKSRSMTNTGNIYISDELDNTIKNNIDNMEKGEYDNLEEWLEIKIEAPKRADEERTRLAEEEALRIQEELAKDKPKSPAKGAKKK